LRTINEEVSSSWTRWQSAKSTIQAAEQAVTAIEKAAEGIRKESIEGNRTLSDVLDAQNELLAARITLERAIRNEFAARAGLLAAMGSLTVDAIRPGGMGINNGANSPGRSVLGALTAIVSPQAEAVQGDARPGVSALGARRPAPVAIALPQTPNAVTDTRPPTSRLGR
jgi:outer membrane protein